METTTVRIERDLKDRFEQLFEAVYGAKPQTADYLEKQIAQKIEEMELLQASKKGKK
jgi:predicted DNA-binding protein